MFVMSPEIHNMAYNWGVVAASAAVFQVISYAVAKWGTPKSITSERNEKWRWKNVSVSCIHSFMCAVWSLAWYVNIKWN